MRRGEYPGRGRISASIGGALALLSICPACAQEAGAKTPDLSIYGWREISGGVDVARDQWLFYSGTTFAPFSSDIYSNGWRFRFGGGYGQYGYETVGPHENCGVAVLNTICTEDDRERQHFRVSHSYAEALIGYYLQLGRVTAKAFAGASMSTEHHLNGADPGNDNDGIEYGAKGVLELWFDISGRSWSSLDLSYASARNESSSRWRTGWRMTPQLSIGPEFRYDKNVETGDGAWNGRAGLFARYEWTSGEVSLAGGAAWWSDDWKPQDPSAYGSFNVLFHY